MSLIDLEVREEWVGKTLIELDLRRKYALNVVAIRDGESLQINIDPTLKLTSDMKLVVIINKANLQKLK